MIINFFALKCSLNRLETISNLDMVNTGVEDRLAFAHKIALDLFQFMTSFSSGDPSSNNNCLIVPTNIFDKWFSRFEAKYKIDPNFMMKK